MLLWNILVLLSHNLDLGFRHRHIFPPTDPWSGQRFALLLPRVPAAVSTQHKMIRSDNPVPYLDTEIAREHVNVWMLQIKLHKILPAKYQQYRII